MHPLLFISSTSTFISVEELNNSKLEEFFSYELIGIDIVFELLLLQFPRQFCSVC